MVPEREDCGSASWDDLRALALTGRLRGSGIRSVSWKVFLGVLPSNTTSLAGWNACLSEKRAEYDRLVQKFLIDPRGGGDEDLLKNNPLAQAEDSKWTKYFELQELQKCISIDIERLNFDDDYFTRDVEVVQGVMLRILTVWASINTEVSYRQGMHELLAPLLAVLDRDKSAPHAAGDGDAAELAGIMDAAFLEHDAYMLFERLMERIGAAFAPPKRAERGKVAPTRAPVVVRCDRVQNTLLRSRDIELCSHLQSNQVEPQLYMMKWIRLLLGREFHLEDVLLLWDAIFADQHGRAPPTGEEWAEGEGTFPLLDHICVAMLAYIRLDLLDRDNIGCLRRLMKYPPVEDVRVFVASALREADPKNAQLPLLSPAPLPPVSPPANSPRSSGFDRAELPSNVSSAPSPGGLSNLETPTMSSPVGGDAGSGRSAAGLPPGAGAALEVLEGILPPRSDPRRTSAEQALRDLRTMLSDGVSRLGNGLQGSSGRLRGMGLGMGPPPAAPSMGAPLGGAGNGGAWVDVPLHGNGDARGGAARGAVLSLEEVERGEVRRRGVEQERVRREAEAEVAAMALRESEARVRAEEEKLRAAEEVLRVERAEKAAAARKASMAILLGPPSPATQRADTEWGQGKDKPAKSDSLFGDAPSARGGGGGGSLFGDAPGGLFGDGAGAGLRAKAAAGAGEKGGLFGDGEDSGGVGKSSGNKGGGGLFGDDHDSSWLSSKAKSP